MDNKEYIKVSKEIKNYKIARINVMVFILFTVVNMLMLFADRYFLFSIYSSTSFFVAGVVWKELYGNSFLVLGFAIGLLILAVFFVFWLLSKKHRWSMIVLLILFSLDSVVLIVDCISAMKEGVFSLLLDILFHALMMYYLVLGVKSSGELQKHFPQGIKLTVEQLDEAYRLENGIDPRTGAPLNGTSAPSVAENSVGSTVASDMATSGEACVSSDMRVSAAADVSSDKENSGVVDSCNENDVSAAADGNGSAASTNDKPDSPVIEEDTSKGRAVLEARYNNSLIKVKTSPFVWGKAKIIIDGKVYACEKVGGYKNKDISAVLNGVEYIYRYEYHYLQINHYLLANGRIIAAR